MSSLIFKIKQKPHEKYTRKGSDLIYRTQISLADAIDCKSLEIQTLESRNLRVSIDEILSSKTLKEVKNEGMPILENGKPSRKGNLYVRFEIIFPQQLSE